METSWISRNGGILEKGGEVDLERGYDPFTNYDFQEDKINIFDKKVKIYFFSTRHYCIKLKSKLSDENVLKTNAVFVCSNVQNLSNTKKYKVALKLHRQFSHPHSEGQSSLLQVCEINDEELKSRIKDLDEKCEICIKHKRDKLCQDQ